MTISFKYETLPAIVSHARKPNYSGLLGVVKVAESSNISATNVSGKRRIRNPDPMMFTVHRSNDDKSQGRVPYIQKERAHIPVGRRRNAEQTGDEGEDARRGHETASGARPCRSGSGAVAQENAMDDLKAAAIDRQRKHGGVALMPSWHHHAGRGGERESVCVLK